MTVEICQSNLLPAARLIGLLCFRTWLMLGLLVKCMNYEAMYDAPFMYVSGV